MITRPAISRLHQLQWTQLFQYHDIRRPCVVGTTRIGTADRSKFRSSCWEAAHAPSFVKGFSSSTRIQNDGNFVNHYEILGMSPRATKAELKKQFYALSKETHPDRHPDDPKGAAERFSQISESYSILANDEKRRRYDRDFNRVQGQNQNRDGGGGGGGEHAGTYAGSRPASGLSKRRGTFRGPPPSFYAQGGYGKSNNQPSASSSSSSSSSSSTYQQDQEYYQAGTFNASSFQDRPNTEYDPKQTYKTQSQEDIRRMQRRAAQFRAMQAEIDTMNDGDFWGRFVVVTFVVALGVTVGSIVVNMSNSSSGGGLTRADGSKRGAKHNNEWAKG